MAIQLKHAKTVAKADGADATVVQPSDWNASHTLTAAAGKVLGTVVGSTTVSELPIEVDGSGGVNLSNDLKFSGSAGTAGKVLISNGPGVAPSWGTLGVAGGGTGATTVSGILKGNGTGAISAAVAGTDYVVPSGLSGYAPLNSPGFTGTPTAPTAAGGTNNTQIATTAFVQSAVGGVTPPTTLYAIGTYVLGRPANTTSYAANSTVAGSSLYSTSTQGQYDTNWGTFSGESLINTGSWRCVSAAAGNGTSAFSGMWVRYA